MTHIDEAHELAGTVPASDLAQLAAIQRGEMRPRTGEFYRRRFGPHCPIQAGNDRDKAVEKS